jgi:acyl-CoA thioester hydrolase
MDNDVCGHVNNAVYYSFLGTVVNQFLVEHSALNFVLKSSVGLVVHSECDYFAPLPEPLRRTLAVLDASALPILSP